MSNIPSNNEKIQVESVLTREAVSESLLYGMGAAINYCLDKGFAVQTIEFTTPGTHFWTVPTGSVLQLVEGIGGGGSGSGVATIAGGPPSYLPITYPGNGGCSSSRVLKIYNFTSLSTVSIVVGAGGPPVSLPQNGNAGSDTLINGSVFSFGAIGMPTRQSSAVENSNNIPALILANGPNGGIGGTAICSGSRSENFPAGASPYSYGGAASFYGAGGNGSNSGNAQAGQGYGAGGGGSPNYGLLSGAGGNGYLKIINIISI